VKSYGKVLEFPVGGYASLSTGLLTVRNIKWIANEIGYVDKLETVKDKTGAKGSCTGALSVGENVHAGRRIIRGSGKLWGFSRRTGMGGKEGDNGARGLDWCSKLEIYPLKRLQNDVSGRRMKQVLVHGAGPRRLA